MIFTQIIFIIAVAIFIIGTMMNFVLFFMYFNAYRNKKQSEIIKTLYRLFFFKAIMFLGLALLSFAQFAGNPQLGIILRVITLPVFVAIIWELFQFAKWSTEPDGIDEEKLMETKLEKQHKNHKVSFGGYEV